jgi:hypothetical protein
MKQALINILMALDGQSVLGAQLAADVSALKTVVSQLSPEVAEALAERIRVESDRFQKLVESQRLLLEALKKGISEIPN